MVIGSGFLAKAFRRYKNRSDVLIFASGVSNSNEQDSSEYERENNLLRQVDTKKHKTIYFSTCSVFDKSQKNSPYVRHKLNMEQYIKEHFNSYIIFRLPIVVGRNKNPHTLTNYLNQKIKHQVPFVIFKNAYRYLMDVKDVVTLLSRMIDSDIYDNSIMNICFNNKIFIAELVEIFAAVLHTKPHYTEEYIGNCYNPDNKMFIEHIKKIKFTIDADYNYRIIKKYYGEI